MSALAALRLLRDAAELRRQLVELRLALIRMHALEPIERLIEELLYLATDLTDHAEDVASDLLLDLQQGRVPDGSLP